MNDFSPEERKELRQWATGQRTGHHRRTCPACSPTRRNSKATCLSVTIHPEHMVMQCHHCEKRGAVRLVDNEMNKPFLPPPVAKPSPKAVKSIDSGLTEAGIKFIMDRGISLKTAQVFSLVSSRSYFLNIKRETDAIALPYFVSGKVFGHKVRSIEEKDHVCDKALASLFGIQNVDLKESEDLIICEGEWDALAYYEADVVNATSVPNGSSSFARSDEGTERETLGFLWDAREVIDKAKRVLISPDNDDVGEKLAEELARRIGKHRCWRIVYPADCKDANDVLLKHGKARLKQCYDEAEAWPVAGLYEADHFFEAVDHLYEHGFGERISTGMSAVDEYFSVGPGLLTIVTGNPNAGKSNWVNQIMINLARRYKYSSAICSFETPPQVHIGQLAEMLMQRHFFDVNDGGERMTKKDLTVAKQFVMRYMKFMHQEDGKKATIESIIERIKTAVFRWGVKVIVIDPYNYVHRPTNMESETQFIDDMLTQVRLTAALYGVHVFFIAHPKMPQVNADGTTPVPKGYSISGSAAWFSKPDHGITVHRKPDSPEVEIHIWKTRFSWLGKNGMCTLTYDSTRHQYISDNWADFLPYEGDE